jgi:NADH:ubiquinone reductase (non-electrogenic)
MVSSYDEVPNGRKKRVVVLGSGWGAAALLKHLDRSQFEITCVSPRNYFLMTPRE